MHTPPLPDPVPTGGAAPSPGLRVAFITHYTELYGANLSLLNLIEGLGREFGRGDYDLRRDFGARRSRLWFRSADALIFVSHALRRAFLGRATPANARVIYNGVAPEAAFDERRRAAEARRGRRGPFT